MTYDDFERRLLKIVFEEKKESLTPSFLAYKLQIPHSTVKQHLDQAIENGLVEINTDDDGKVIYTVPGFDPNAAVLPNPHYSPPLQSFGTPGPSDSNFGVSANDPVASYSSYEPGYPGPLSIDEEARQEVDQIAPYGRISGNANNLPSTVSSSDEIELSHSRYSVYTKKFRVYNNFSKIEIERMIEDFLGTLGYSFLNAPEELTKPDNLLFKRGSITFILLMIPFFILVIPIIVYAIMHLAGYSTIRNEPVYLEVEKNRIGGPTPGWEITLTYRGMHGIVFGKPDTDVLDAEVETFSNVLNRPY